VIEARDLGKSFLKDDRYIVALTNFSLTVQPGSFVCMLGRSGCGKSTILNLMAGLTKPTEGTVTYQGKTITRPNPDVGYLTQSDTLMPWRDVRHNVELPLEIRGTKKTRRHKDAQRLIDAVGLTGFERHYPRELSGGMRRRASLARLLINQPDTLLLDEPFGALDAYLRKEMQDLLLSLTQGKTVVFVTHDVDEAVTLADRVVTLGERGTIVTDVRNDLPRPRDPDDPGFIALRQKVASR
jgi:NitT/TauT family transport system ATP-binding protein